MQDSSNNENREEVYSRIVRAGKRTYFFDVKESRYDEPYLIITESIKRFERTSGGFYYEKHKIFIDREDFDKFADGLNSVIQFVKTGIAPPNLPNPTRDEVHLSDLSMENFKEFDEEPESRF